MAIKSLIINPGSTSTKIGVFEDENLLFEETLRHSTEEIAQYASIIDQKDFRKNIILEFLKVRHAGDAWRAVDAPVFKKDDFPFQAGSCDFRAVDVLAVVKGRVSDFDPLAGFRRMDVCWRRNGGQGSGKKKSGQGSHMKE